MRGGRPGNVGNILISETMRIGVTGYAEAAGVWEPKESRIVIERDLLGLLESYAGTLLHEVGPASSGAPDLSSSFEDALTTATGGTPAIRRYRAEHGVSPWDDVMRIG